MLLLVVSLALVAAVVCVGSVLLIVSLWDLIQAARRRRRPMEHCPRKR